MSNQVLGMPVIGGYLGAFWTTVTLIGVFVTSNTAPPPPELKWKEGVAFTNTKLEVEIAGESVDPDGSGVHYYFQWFRNGELVKGADSKTINDKQTTAGETWKVVVTPDDGTLGGSLCGVPWRECAEIGRNAATLELAVQDSPPRPRIRFLNKDNREVTQLAGGTTVQMKLGCTDADDDEARGRAIEKAAAAGQPPAPVDPNAPDPCTYDIQWVNVDSPPAPGEKSPLNGTSLPGSQTKSGQVWKAIVVATKDGVAGEPAEAKLNIL